MSTPIESAPPTETTRFAAFQRHFLELLPPEVPATNIKVGVGPVGFSHPLLMLRAERMSAATGRTTANRIAVALGGKKREVATSVEERKNRSNTPWFFWVGKLHLPLALAVGTSLDAQRQPFTIMQIAHTVVQTAGLSSVILEAKPAAVSANMPQDSLTASKTGVALTDTSDPPQQNWISAVEKKILTLPDAMHGAHWIFSSHPNGASDSPLSNARLQELLQEKNRIRPLIIYFDPGTRHSWQQDDSDLFHA